MNVKCEGKRGKFIAWLILALSICVMAVFSIKLWEVHQVYREGNESYEQLVNKVRSGGTPVIHTPEAADTNIPDMAIDFTALRAINRDSVAWLYCPDTVIDYPVMKAADYDYYLHHLPDGTYNANGSLFIDYNNAPDFSDRLTVIYGHNMKSGRMFAALEGYKKQDYFEEHPYMYLYTESGNYRVDLMYGCVIESGQWRDRAFMYDMNLDSLLAYAAHNTTFTGEAQYTEGDKIVVLSTCSYEFDGARYVMIGILRH